MFKLSTLLNFDNIVIQCHDNPDADSIASGFALSKFFEEHKINARLIYSGRFKITKPNLTEMIKELNIPIEYIENINVNGLLITIDCQYGAGNVKKLNAQHVAIIDHHQQEITNVSLTEIRSYLGSCSTLVWQMLSDEGFDFIKQPNISTALYYGLFSDTNSFTEISHPIDKDMRDSLKCDYNLIRKLKNCNLTLNDLEIAGIALIKCFHNINNNYAIFKSHPCDPNILGFISDLALQVNTIDICVVFNQTSRGYKFSVRSCIKEVMANELASYLCEEIGSGGGHIEKAGGYISLNKFESKYGDISVDAYFLNKINEYYDSYEVVYSESLDINIEEMNLYRKTKMLLGFVPTLNIFPEGTPLLVRTLEGDINVLTSNNMYIMIGLKGEVYLINKNEFEQNYEKINNPYNIEIEYFPSVKCKETGDIINLKSFAKSCKPTKEIHVYAKPLINNIKLFTKENTSKYISGEIGDYLIVDKDNINNISIIKKEMFNSTYKLI